VQRRAEIDLPFSARAPAIARDGARAVLTSWHFSDAAWLDDAVIVVAELIANAVLHGGGGRSLRLDADGDRVTVSVVDNSTALPHMRASTMQGGRGLRLVDQLCEAWGTTDHPSGKRVWARLKPAPP
jgi:anti-sigma regulatory factor (Ser/Thr protein kinase)